MALNIQRLNFDPVTGDNASEAFMKLDLDIGEIAQAIDGDGAPGTGIDARLGAVEDVADGLGDAATKDVGMAAGTVAAGDDARFSLSGLKNKLINGNFDIWQRGSSFATTGFRYTSDRWGMVTVADSLVVSRQSHTAGQTDVRSSPRYFLRGVVTSVSGSGNTAFISQSIEGLEQFSGKTITISFSAKASVAKAIGVSVDQNFGTGGTPSAAVLGAGTKVQLTTAWQRFTVTKDIPSTSGKAYGTAVNDSLQLIFWLDAGSSFDARTGAIGQLSSTVDLSEVQVEIGSAATNFEVRPPGLELMLCQRYCPSFLSNGVGSHICSGQAASGTQMVAYIPWVVTPRVPPTSVVVSNVTHFGVSAASTSSINTTNLTFASASIAGGVLVGTAASGLVAGNATSLLFTNASGFMYFEGCEL